MHPIDQISTAFVYVEDPRRISGALYHRVATYSVITGLLSQSELYATERANPKSHSLAWHSEFSKTFDGFKSLCKSYPECIYLSAFKI